MFSIKVHYGGKFTDRPDRTYEGGYYGFVDIVDVDEFSVHEMDAMVEELGNDGHSIMFYHFLIPSESLDNGLQPLASDKDVLNMCKYVRLGHKLLNVYVEHGRTNRDLYYALLISPNKKKRCVIEEIEEDVPKETTTGVIKRLRLDLNRKKGLVEEQGQSSSCVALQIASQSQISVVDNQLPSQTGDTSQVRIQEQGKGSGSGIAIDIPSEIGDSSQVRIPKQSQGSGVANELPSQTTNVPSQFVNEFYSSYDPYLGDDEFNPFDGLDEILPPVTNVQNDRVEVESDAETEVREETETEAREETENEARLESDTEVDGSRSEKEMTDVGTDDDTDADVSDNNDSDDSEYIVDNDNDVEEVAVDMENFRLNVDLEAEFHGCDSDNGVQDLDVDIDDVFDNDEFISGSENDDEFDKARKIKLKQLRKQSNSNPEGKIYKTYFYVGQDFGTAAEVKKLIKRHSIETRREIKIVKNDKERVRAQCFGQLPSLETSGLSAGQKDQVGPNVGPSVAVGSSQPSGSLKDKKSADKIKVIKGGKPNCRKVDANKCPWVLHVSKVKGSETWRTKTYDAEHRCLQSRDILYATSRFFAEDIVDQIEKNPDIPIRALQDQLQKNM